LIGITYVSTLSFPPVHADPRDLLVSAVFVY